MSISKEKALSILEKIKEDVKEAENDASMRLDKWLERMAFYRGLHYTVAGGEFHIDIDDPIGEAREVHNFIPAFVKAAVATRIQHFPNPQVPAIDGNQTSLARAMSTERLLKSFVDDDILAGEEFIRALTSSAIVGGAWLKVYWDPFSGKAIPAERETEDIELDDGFGGIITETIERELEKDVFGAEIPVKAFEGQIKVALVDLFDGWRDPAASKPSEMRYWVHRKIRPAEELQRRFPKDMWGKKITWAGGHLDGLWSQKQSVMSSEMENNIGGAGSEDADGRRNSLTTVYEYWGAPTEEYPNGIMCFFSNQHILYLGPCPYVPARIPVTFLPGDNIVPGGFFPDGVVENLIAPQKTLNRSESKIRETLDRMLNPHILVPHASDVDEEIFGEVGGQVIKYNAGYPPHILHSPEVPSSMFNISSSMIARMREISTYSDISRGDVPGRVESGRAIAFLQENENNIRTADVKLYKKAVLDAMKHCLWLSRQFYQEGRLIRTLGEDSWTLYEFQAEDYDWDIDLAPEPFSGAPNSRALRWAETIEAFQMGLYDDDRPGSKDVRKILEIDHAERSTMDKDSIHRDRARMENDQALQRSKGKYMGPINPVREFHDNEIHLEEHNHFRNTQEYLDLTPEARAMLDAHCEEHEEFLEKQMQNFAQNQQMVVPPKEGEQKIPGIESPMDGGSKPGESQ